MADFSAAFSDLVPGQQSAAPPPDFNGAFSDLVPAQKTTAQLIPEAAKAAATPVSNMLPRSGFAGILNNQMTANILHNLYNIGRGIPAAIQAVGQDASVMPGLRREDYTDVPGTAQPSDPLVRDATNIAAGTLTPSAGRLVGTTEAGVLGEGGGRITAKPDSIMPDRAARLIAKKFVEDKIAPADVAQAALDQAKVGATGTLPLDLGGDSVRRLAGSTYRTGKEAGQTIATRLDERAAGQGERLGQTLTETLADPNLAYKTADDIYSARAAEAKKAYEPAYKVQLNQVSPQYSEIMSDLATPAGQAAMKKADEIIANKEGSAKSKPFTVNEDGSISFAKPPDTQTLHAVLRGFDDVIDANKVDAGFGRQKLTQVGGAVQDLKERIRSNLGDLNPLFAKAQQRYADQSTLRSAIDAGMDALGKPGEVVAAEIAKLPDAAKDMYRLGFARSVQRAKLNSDGDVTRGLLKPEFLKTMQAVYPDAASFEQAQNHILAEQRQMRNRYQVTGNSATAMRGADDANAGVAGAIGNVVDYGKSAASGGVVGVVKTAAGKGLDWYVNNKLGLNDPKLAAEVADMLTTRISDPQKFGAVMRRVNDEYKRIKR